MFLSLCYSDLVLNSMKLLKKFAKSVLLACNRQKTLDLSTSENTELKRCLSTLDLTFIGVGSTLGSGIYVLTGEIAKNKSGPAIVISFLIAGIASVLSGLCYAEFGARIPKAGSAYIYCYLTVGEFCAFVIGWNIILEYVIGGATIARSTSTYLDTLFGGVIRKGIVELTGEINVSGISQYLDFFSMAMVLLFTVFITLGVKHSARLNNFCVMVNITTVFIVIVVGAFYADVENWKNFAPYGFEGIISGASTCFFAFIGFDVIATTCEEARNPARSIPFSMIGTITICFLAYFGVSGVITLMVPYNKLDSTAAVTVAFNQRNLKAMGYIVGVGATAGLLGCTLITMIPLPRLLYAMSQDGMIMKCFSKVNPKTQVPVISTVFSGCFIGILSAIFDIDTLVEMLSIGTLLAYSIVDICVIILRYKVPTTTSVVGSEEILVVSEHVDFNSKSEVINTEITDQTTLLVDESVQENGCFHDGCTFQNNPLITNVVVLVIVVILCGISVLLSKFHDKIFEIEFSFILILLSLVLMLFSCCFYLCRLQSYATGLSFSVPLVPWLPVLALFFNIYLILGLSRLTFIRFAVWMTLGLVVYFGYSMHHSSERIIPTDTSEGYLLLNVRQRSTYTDGSSPSNADTVPLLKSGNKMD